MKKPAVPASWRTTRLLDARLNDSLKILLWRRRPSIVGNMHTHRRPHSHGQTDILLHAPAPSNHVTAVCGGREGRGGTALWPLLLHLSSSARLAQRCPCFPPYWSLCLAGCRPVAESGGIRVHSLRPTTALTIGNVGRTHRHRLPPPWRLDSIPGFVAVVESRASIRP